jgi:CHAT domain-containing protein
LACASSCSRKDDPQAAYDHAFSVLRQGDLRRAEEEAHRECQRYRGSNPEWTWKFRTLEANAFLQQGRYEDTLKLLKSEPLPSGEPDLAIPVLWLQGEADLETHNFPEAESSLEKASAFCATSTSPRCGYVLKARGLLAAEQNQWASAEQLFELALAFARSHNDALLTSIALLNLGNAALSQGRFDEAIDRSEDGYQAAQAAGSRRFQLITQANIAWAYYKLGDYEKALSMAEKARDLAVQLGDVWNQEEALINIGDIYMDERKFDQAAQAFQQSLSLSRGINAKEDIYNNLRVLARLSLQTGDLVNASQYAQQALGTAQKDNIHINEIYPMLVQGQIAARRGDNAVAESTFQQIDNDNISPIALKWEAEHSLARLYEDENRLDLADGEYRIALATFESARDSVRHEDSQLSFLTNASHIYDDYVHFMVAHGKTDDALRWADYSRARTLAEGLGLLAKGASIGPPLLNPQQIARRAEGVVLFYWLGEKQSYLWAISPQKTSLFTLPPRAEIDAAVGRYREAVGTEDVLAVANSDGRWLYRTLIAPAEPLPKGDAKVFLVPDGSLNNLNFETLLVPGPESKLHYWIEDATIANASSLRVLGAAGRDKGASQKNRDRTLLLMGASVAPNSKYPELPKAADQMESVARYFPAIGRRVIAGAQATPTAYLTSNLEKFSYIHFVAHGTASPLSPLDSAIILSKGSVEDDSFKLYAREIIRHPLQANLVTIAACYSAGERAYSGEGLIGLAWAFLRAGAHNVIAASWEATDASTEQLMDSFYEQLNRGSTPDVALRTAKLSLLRSDSAFRKPFYWAPFQLFAGSQ